ncbi:MAG: DUF4330 domain-containing protein [Clostridia bacterium]|nr:DUF4330 domain-containing protein [Clostridia bacterium]
MIKDGKLFGKINLFDALIIILILVMIIAGVSKFRTFNKAVESNSSGKITYTVVIGNVRSYSLSAFQSGDSVFDSLTDINIGKIVNVESRNAQIIRSLSNGKTIIAENPYKKDIILTIETPGSSTNSSYFANKSVELKVGSEKNIETLYTTTLGKIGSIKYTEGE